MKDEKLTEIMFRSLHKDSKLASYNEWNNAGDFALEMRFFPHALQCYRLAAELNKSEIVLRKIDDLLDKITNVLEFVPPRLKALIEDIRLNNPLDPERWVSISNSLLQDFTTDLSQNKKPNDEDLDAAKFALAFSAYASIRSGCDIEPINNVISDLIDPVDEKININKKIHLRELGKDGASIKVVALGDNVTLGLTSKWEIRFQETYHYLWAKESKSNISLASNAVSGAGVLDLALYLGRDAIYYKPQIALINFGVNDAWLGHSIIPGYEALLEVCVKILKKHNIIPVLISPIPHIPTACPENQRPTDVDLAEVEIEAYVKAMKRVALRTDVIFADAYAQFPKTDIDRKKYLENGFNQPNLAGQKLIKAALDAVTEF